MVELSPKGEICGLEESWMTNRFMCLSLAILSFCVYATNAMTHVSETGKPYNAIGGGSHAEN